jgi:hypothetical protein
MPGPDKRRQVLGPLVVLGVLLGFSPVESGQADYDEAIGRASHLLSRQPEKVVLVERAARSHLHQDRPNVEAFVVRGDRTVYLVRQGVTLQAALKEPGVFDFALAAIIWHEMAHIDGADEAAAQEAEEQLWTEFVLAQRVDRKRGLQYLALLKKRRQS